MTTMTTATSSPSGAAFVFVSCRNASHSNETKMASSMSDDDTDFGAVLYIIVVLTFYSLGIVIMIVKYLKTEKKEMEEEMVLESFFKGIPNQRLVNEKEAVKRVAIQAFHTLTAAKASNMEDLDPDIIAASGLRISGKRDLAGSPFDGKSSSNPLKSHHATSHSTKPSKSGTNRKSLGMGQAHYRRERYSIQPRYIEKSLPRFGVDDDDDNDDTDDVKSGGHSFDQKLDSFEEEPNHGEIEMKPLASKCECSRDNISPELGHIKTVLGTSSRGLSEENESKRPFRPNTSTNDTEILSTKHNITRKVAFSDAVQPLDKPYRRSSEGVLSHPHSRFAGSKFNPHTKGSGNQSADDTDISRTKTFPQRIEGNNSPGLFIPDTETSQSERSYLLGACGGSDVKTPRLSESRRCLESDPAGYFSDDSSSSLLGRIHLPEGQNSPQRTLQRFRTPFVTSALAADNVDSSFNAAIRPIQIQPWSSKTLASHNLADGRPIGIQPGNVGIQSSSSPTSSPTSGAARRIPLNKNRVSLLGSRRTRSVDSDAMSQTSTSSTALINMTVDEDPDESAQSCLVTDL